MTKTKIIATLGPACDDQETIKELILNGVSIFRLNFKHSSFSWHRQRLERIKTVEKSLGLSVGVMVDLKGPELRIGKLKKEPLKLKKGEIVGFGPKEKIVFSNLLVLKDLKKGEKILLDDGRIVLRILKTAENLVQAEVLTSGLLYSHKGVNLPESEVNLPTLDEIDLRGISLAKEYGVDFIALSFIRTKEDVASLRRVLEREHFQPMVIAKIENKLAIENFEQILSATDGVMVARGDLGVELPIEEVPFWQKYIIERCLRSSKPVITATEMLSSMVENSRPTRAEVSDIGNSVYDRTDALLLSAETAIGNYPVEAVRVMRKTCQFIEGKLTAFERKLPVYNQVNALVLAAFDLVEKSELAQPFAAFVVLTENGKTARILSSLRPNLPVLAITPNKRIQRQLYLSFGVEPFYFDYQKIKKEEVVKKTIDFLQKKGKLKKGEKVVMIYGDDWHFPGRTNLVRIQEV